MSTRTSSTHNTMRRVSLTHSLTDSLSHSVIHSLTHTTQERTTRNSHVCAVQLSLFSGVVASRSICTCLPSAVSGRLRELDCVTGDELSDLLVFLLRFFYHTFEFEAYVSTFLRMWVDDLQGMVLFSSPLTDPRPLVPDVESALLNDKAKQDSTVDE